MPSGTYGQVVNCDTDNSSMMVFIKLSKGGLQLQPIELKLLVQELPCQQKSFIQEKML